MNAEVAQVYVDTVKARVASNNHTSWGGDDSLAVIEAVSDTAYLGDKPEGFDAIREVVKAVINPSAFRQQLEKLPATDPMHVVKEEGKKRGGNSLAAAMSLLTQKS